MRGGEIEARGVFTRGWVLFSSETDYLLQNQFEYFPRGRLVFTVRCCNADTLAGPFLMLRGRGSHRRTAEASRGLTWRNASSAFAQVNTDVRRRPKKNSVYKRTESEGL